jgi:hypothetical protein
MRMANNAIFTTSQCEIGPECERCLATLGWWLFSLCEAGWLLTPRLETVSGEVHTLNRDCRLKKKTLHKNVNAFHRIVNVEGRRERKAA